MADRSIISPTPTDEEAAAIVAALTMAWPRPAEAVRQSPIDNRWRLSGRWWAKPSWRQPRL